VIQIHGSLFLTLAPKNETNAILSSDSVAAIRRGVLRIWGSCKIEPAANGLVSTQGALAGFIGSNRDVFVEKSFTNFIEKLYQTETSTS